MFHSQIEKNLMVQTSFTYCSDLKSQQSVNTPSLNKQNVVPCSAQIHSLISTLSQKKHQLKNSLFKKQQLLDIENQQQQKINSESIKQSFEIGRQIEFLNQNKRVLEDVQNMKKEKIKISEKLLLAKKLLQEESQKIISMKKFLNQIRIKNFSIERQVQQTKMQNQALHYQIDELGLICQNIESETFHMKEKVRESQVKQQIAHAALQKTKSQFEPVINSIKKENKIIQQLPILISGIQQKQRKLRQQTTECDINSNELTMKNHYIKETNQKLRNDLEKCKTHLACFIKNNELLRLNLKEFTEIDEKACKIIKKDNFTKF